jgi:4-amino-4-deoxy-L-arabinose transferase-like glycosyltransferase
LIALVNAAIWAAVVPPFQVPDETFHFAYAQYLAETGRPPPQGPGNPYSRQEQVAVHKLWFFSVLGHPEQRAILTAPEDRELHAALGHGDPRGSGGASSASNQPPLYYGIEAVAYLLTPSGNILARLALMRLVSALMAAATVLAIFLFLRELMPRSPWTWTVGALAVAFQPMFNFIAAGVQVDNLLFLASAATFLVLLRAYRRGLTLRRGVLLGAVVATGLLAKLTFLAVVPGVVLALLLLAWRARGDGGRRVARALGAAVAVAALPVALYALLNVAVWHRGGPAGGGLAEVASNPVVHGGAITTSETIEYIWQLYLPRLWFMAHSYFHGYPLWRTWFDGTIGHFGWLDYWFPAWVYDAARYLLYALVPLAVVGVARLRREVRAVLPIFACFAVMAAGLLIAIGYAGIRFRVATGNQFEQARYLFPLLTFYALFVVLAARGAGRRWAPALGAALAVLAMAHGLFAETLTISRYYG